MLLAVFYLCAWDYHRVRSIFTKRPWDPELPVPDLKLDWLERIGFWVFAVSLLGVFGVTRSLVSTAWVPSFIIVGVVAGLLTLVRFLVTGWRLKALERAANATGQHPQGVDG